MYDQQSNNKLSKRYAGYGAGARCCRILKYDKVRCIAVATCDDSEEVPAGNYTARVLMFVDKAVDASALRSPDGMHDVQVRRLVLAS